MPPETGTAPAPDRTDLLLHAWELERSGRLVELRALLEALDGEVLAGEPDLGLLLSSMYLHLRDLERAERMLERLAGACRGRGNDRLHRRYLNQSGLLLLYVGRLDECRAVQAELMSKSLMVEDASTLLWSTMHMGVIHHYKCEWAEAVAQHNRAIALARTVDGGKWLAAVQHNLGCTYRHMGLLDAAERQYEASRRHARADHFPPMSDMERAELMRMRGDLDMAESLAARARAGFASLRSGTFMSFAALTVTHIEMARGRLDRARAALDEARALLPANEVIEWAELYEEQAVLEWMDGNAAASADARERATAIYTRMDAPRRIAAMLQRMRPRPTVLVGAVPVYRG